MVSRRPLFGPGSPLEFARIADLLRAETVGGVLLVVAAAVALGWANSPWGDVYAALGEYRVGPAGWDLDLTLAQWASDGLLAIFFFVVGLELTREFVAGDLRDPRAAALPIAAAVGGMAVPALLYTVVNVAAPDGQPVGWAVPTATDIAFALAVLAVVGPNLPTALRTFLLTLAVVDDLLAILVIAVVYTDTVAPVPLALTGVPLAAFAVLVRRGIRAWWLLVPLAVAMWVLLHASGVHATVAGMLLGFAVPVTPRDGGPGLAAHLEHRFRPLSAGFAVPVFAFFAAGVAVAGADPGNPVTAGVVLGLVVGKPVGVLGVTWLVQRCTRARLAAGVSWWDLLGVALLGGIGFTVSLLIGALAFGLGTPHDDHVTTGVLLGSAVSALLATVVLRWPRPAAPGC